MRPIYTYFVYVVIHAVYSFYAQYIASMTVLFGNMHATYEVHVIMLCIMNVINADSSLFELHIVRVGTVKTPVSLLA